MKEITSENTEAQDSAYKHDSDIEGDEVSGRSVNENELGKATRSACRLFESADMDFTSLREGQTTSSAVLNVGAWKT